MIKRFMRSVVLMTAPFGLVAFAAPAQQPASGAQQERRQPDETILRPSVSTTRLAVADFVARTSATAATKTAADVFNRVLWDDLEFSAFFRMPSRSFYPLRPLRTPADVSFESWQVPTLDVDYLIFGNLQVDASSVVVEAFLYDVKTRSQILGKRFTIPEASMVRGLAHAFADEAVFRLSAGASRGVAQSLVAFSSKRGEGKELFLVDYDGFNQRTVTANGGLNKFPNFSADNERVAFVTNLPGSSRWELWVQELGGKGERRVVQVPTSYVSSPAFSPDGSRIAFAARGRNKPSADIYVATLSSAAPSNLTNHPGIDTSPSWSPTGRQIAFISDRSGTPQVWVMDSDGSNLRRLVNEGGHCDSPDWSPHGKLIAYSWQAPRQWKHDIFVLEVATGRINQL
ncbi:MAG: hypothetical protein V3T83_05080, partial [Acidobacteriota bacterium]